MVKVVCPGAPCPFLVRSVIQDEHEGAAKKGLAVLTEMWRRHVSELSGLLPGRLSSKRYMLGWAPLNPAGFLDSYVAVTATWLTCISLPAPGLSHGAGVAGRPHCERHCRSRVAQEQVGRRGRRGSRWDGMLLACPAWETWFARMQPGCAGGPSSCGCPCHLDPTLCSCLCSRVMLAALKFFLGQDAAEDKGDGGSTIRWLRGSGAALCA